MTDKKVQRKKLRNRLQTRYRLVVMNDETFKERASLLLTPLNVIVLGGATVIFLIVLVTYLIAFTPLREYVPGYADVNLRRQVFENTLRADSLENELLLKDLYLQNLNNVIAGETPVQRAQQPDTSKDYSAIEFNISEQDSLLRAMVEQEERYNIQDLSLVLSASGQPMYQNNTRNLFFFAPVKGEVTSGFDVREKHYAVDVVAKENEPIKATLDGTVILSTWTYDAGHIIGIQHSGNLMSLYKHCSVLLKKTGKSVKAGEVIAVVGNSGELTTGPHLHFELWFNGHAVDPQEHIVF